MTLSTLLINFTIAAIILTGIMVALKQQKNLVMTFFQNFAGVWYLFSGWVKAIDPLGTAYKMEQYFGEFESTFESTWFSFITPIFPALSNIAIYFSVFMIILEIILGLALILGAWPKLTARVFLVLLAFFTFLTGFTYLTGYVGEGVNFFQFGKWGSYDANNMKVTDCGCFGDFIKLEPKTSFIKDCFLLLPAIYFVLRSKDMHQLFTKKARGIILGVSTAGLMIYCLSNYVWDIPHLDFRPFKAGTDVKAQYNAELDAMSSVRILTWKLKNKKSNTVVELSNDVYMKEFKSYPKAEWEIIDQIKSEPAIKATKISEMDFTSLDGHDMSEELLEEKEPFFMIVAHKLKASSRPVKRIVIDTLYKIDTIQQAGDDQPEIIVNSFDRVEEREITTMEYDWDASYLEDFKKLVTPMAQAAAKKNIKTYIVAGGADPAQLEALEAKINTGATYLKADDILLKTIVRSNPGFVLWNKGKITNKWHKAKFPGFENCGL